MKRRMEMNIFIEIKTSNPNTLNACNFQSPFFFCFGFTISDTKTCLQKNAPRVLFLRLIKRITTEKPREFKGDGKRKIIEVACSETLHWAETPRVQFSPRGD